MTPFSLKLSAFIEGGSGEKDVTSLLKLGRPTFFFGDMWGWQGKKFKLHFKETIAPQIADF